eukprot:1159381-Pelagomonas_calceolata.AAC.6
MTPLPWHDAMTQTKHHDPKMAPRYWPAVSAGLTQAATAGMEPLSGIQASLQMRYLMGLGSCSKPERYN